MHGKPSHLCNMIFYVKTVEKFKINTKTCIKKIGYFKDIVVYETLKCYIRDPRFFRARIQL